jgi:hypothetical protein
MADTLTVGQELEGYILDTVRKSEEVAVGAINVMIDAVQPVTAAIPGMTPPLAYDFAEQLMMTQRKFAEDVFRATARLTPTMPKKATAAQK